MHGSIVNTMSIFLAVFVKMEHVTKMFNGYCSLKMSDKLQKTGIRTVGPSLAITLGPLAHRQNLPSFSIGITLVDFYLNWSQFHFLIFVGGLLVILTDRLIFLSPFLDVL